MKTKSSRNQQVRSDCEELLARFQQTDSVRFEVFSQIWREMKFGHIFFGTAGREKRAFGRAALDVAAVYFLPPFSFQIRAGGLYLLHGLYHCQTASPRVPIRLALKDWEDVLAFEKDAVGAQHLDAVFLLRQLLLRKAFHFAAMPALLTFKRSKEEARSRLCKRFVARARGPQELVGRDAMEELSNIHHLYGKLKSSVFSEAQRERLGVALIRHNLPAQLRGHVVSFHGWQKRKQQEESDDEDEGDGEGTSSRAESSRRAQLLSSIKSKAYGQAAETCKSRRHRQVEVNAGEESGPALSKVRSKSSKVSLKARTTENVCIIGDMSKEAATSTRIHHLTALDRGGRQAQKDESAGE
ncbi:snRNA-activating protein complex subunit 1b [Hippocampus comes]|uniref:Small nuclear RNA activating complex polypeptide 1 n=1 Tax=Hippocampus comes TaxID=109280 RepID=A0A3Q2Z8Z6_HIPCM|nr:PREDICTED: snRNA-activating protein complex subunit 1 [Hippocampus comes]